MLEPVVADAPRTVYRVARRDSLLRSSQVTPEDAALPRAGNRFDVPGGGVLYCGSTEEACFAETLSRFRPTPAMRSLLRDEEGFMVVGTVAQDWRLRRILGTIEIENPLPFLDVEPPETHAYLSNELAPVLLALGYTTDLDFADICNRDRRLSRAIAAHAYTATDEDGSFRYSGIRYKSRIDSTWECWAVFEGTHVEEVENRSIPLQDPALQRVAQMWGLHVF